MDVSDMRWDVVPVAASLVEYRLVIIIVGLAIAINAVRSLVQGENMADRKNTTTSLVNGFFAIIAGLGMAYLAWKMLG